MLTLLLLAHAHAAEVGGYFRLQARPDLVGGDGRLGTSVYYGRLLNEGPWALLDLRQPLVKGEPGTPGGAPWGALALRVEGGVVGGGDATNGNLLGFRLSQLHITAGNVGPANVTWRVGTLETTFGDLWLYDARPTQMLVDVMGASATWSRDGTELMLGVGDAGWSIHGPLYQVVASAGGSARHRGDHVEVGVGGQAWYQPESPTRDHGWKFAGTVGFGELGPLRWNRLQVIVLQRMPHAPVGGDQRHELVIGDEVELVLVPERLEVAAAALFEHRFDAAAGPGGGESDRTAISGVLRTQVGLTPAFGLLGETSLAREVARQGERKDTWQGKAGVVLSPAGSGLGARPALRALYGVQRSNMPGAWPGATEDDDGLWHHLVSLEAEAWF